MGQILETSRIKLGARNTTHAVAIALRFELIQFVDPDELRRRAA